jgi:hypothetical protein
MQYILKIVRSQWKSLKTSWSNHFIYGQGHLIFLMFLTFLNLWIYVLLVIDGDYLYTSCVLKLCPFALINDMNYLSIYISN